MSIGFIKDELDTKMLILYILNHVAAPIDFYQIIDLGMCDPGADYFSLSTALGDLVKKEQVRLEDGLYSITDIGRKNSLITEDSLPYAIRRRCDRNLIPLNEKLRRNAQIRANKYKNKDGTYRVELIMDDDNGNLMTLSLLAASSDHADMLIRRFLKCPERIYNGVIDTMLTDYKEEQNISEENNENGTSQ